MDSRFCGNDRGRAGITTRVSGMTFSVTPMGTFPSVTPRSGSDEGSSLLHLKEKRKRFLTSFGMTLSLYSSFPNVSIGNPEVE